LDGNVRWRYGKKVLLFNLIAVLVVFVLGKIGSYFYNDPTSWYYNTLILVAPISSILYWVFTALQFRGSLRERFMVSLIGSSVYWLITGYLIVSAALSTDFFDFGGRVLLAVVAGIAAVICMLVINFVKRR
jgi:hypothetical protein